MGAGAVYSLGFQNQRVHIVLEASKSAGWRVQKVMSQRAAGLCTRCTRANAFPGPESMISGTASLTLLKPGNSSLNTEHTEQADY